MGIATDVGRLGARKQGRAMSAAAVPVEREDHPNDECTCCHFRGSHSGRGEKKKCTSKVFAGGALGDGKCDCVNFKLKKEAR